MKDDLEELHRAWAELKRTLWRERVPLGAFMFTVWLVSIGNAVIQYGLK